MTVLSHHRDSFPVTKRRLVAAALCLSFGLTGSAFAANDTDTAIPAIRAEIIKRHDESIARLREWLAVPAVAAENLNYPAGPEQMAKLASDAGFQHVEIIPTDGKPGVFATLDAGAERTVALYFLYDVKQYDASEWSSPPLEGHLVDKPGFGKVIIGRGAVNQKGPQSALLAALHAIRGAGQKLPVNLVLVAEGEEEIGSPHIGQFVLQPRVREALSKSIGIFAAYPLQGPDGTVTINLGAKGIVEVELVASGKEWGRGPSKDIHSSYKAMVDSPVWHLVNALSSMVTEDGNTITIDNFPATPALSERDRAMIANAVKERSEEKMKTLFGVTRWIDDLSWQQANERLVSQPTLNIEGIFAGYTGEGGKTVLPTRATAKLDLRLPPGITSDSAVDALKKHLANHGYGDIQVTQSGGYNATTTSPDAPLIQAQIAALRKEGIEPVLWPRGAGSFPGYIFSDPPLSLPVGLAGVGHGGAQHAPDEYFVIESTNPRIKGYDDAVSAYVDYLFELAK